MEEDEGHVWGRQYPFPENLPSSPRPWENTQETGQGFSA